MQDTTKGQRERPISYRPPKKLRQEFHDRVARSGLTANAYITQAVFGREPPRQSRRPSVEHREVGRLLAELAALRDRLHAIERAAVEGVGTAPLLADAVRQLGELRAACFQALGRKP